MARVYMAKLRFDVRSPVRRLPDLDGIAGRIAYDKMRENTITNAIEKFPSFIPRAPRRAKKLPRWADRGGDHHTGGVRAAIARPVSSR